MTATRKCFQILITGATGAGKTSLLQRYDKDTFSEEYHPSEWLQMKMLGVKVDGHDDLLRIGVRDADGRRQYESHSCNYYTKMDAVIVIYDLSDQKSVESVKDICDLIKEYCESEEKIPCAVLVGNKSDKEREVNRTDLKDFAEKENMFYIETSAKTGDNVKNMFMLIINELIKRHGFPECKKESRESQRNISRPPETTTNNSGCSCVIV